MKPYLRLFHFSALSALCLSAWAQTAPPAKAPAAAPTSAPAKREVPDAKVERLDVKDDAVLIEELRIRGETKRLSVTPKNAPAYQIAPESGSKPLDDKSQGQRTWRLFTF